MKGVELRLELPNGSFPGVDRTIHQTDGVRRDSIMHADWEADSISLIYKITAEEPGAAAQALEHDESVHQYDIIDIGGDKSYVFVNSEQSDLLKGLLATPEDSLVLVQSPFKYMNDGMHIKLAGEMEDIQSVHDHLNRFVDLEINWIGDFIPDSKIPLSRLTDRQREALETAHKLGFYEVPRQASTEELAAELDCVPSTVNNLLQRAEAEIISAMLDF